MKVKTDPSIILNNNYKWKHTKKTQNTSLIGIITCVSQYENHFCVIMFCKIPHLAITGHAPPPPFWPHFEIGA